MKSLFTILVAIAPAMAAADDMKSMQQAMELGSILAAEEFCGFAYDQAAVSAWIDENVEASDMAFASNLSMYVDGAGYSQAEMAGSQKTAHCRAVEQTAKHLAFLK